MYSHRSSHTHCQAAQSQAQTKACQRSVSVPTHYRKKMQKITINSSIKTK
jgi:hypothetical protein